MNRMTYEVGAQELFTFGQLEKDLRVGVEKFISI